MTLWTFGSFFNDIYRLFIIIISSILIKFTRFTRFEKYDILLPTKKNNKVKGVLTDVGVLTPIVGEGINISFDSILDIYSTTWITFLDRYQNIKNIIIEIQKSNIETRPLICGSMGKQPFWVERYGQTKLPNADLINEYAIYLPNNPDMSEEDILRITSTINSIDKRE